MTDTDKPAFVQAVVALATALREPEPDALLLRVYFDGLKDLAVEFVTAAAGQLVRAGWFPKVTEWRAMAAKVEAERVAEQRARLRKLPSPLCHACSDTGWAPDAAGRVAPCDCRTLRRLELLGRRPWPTLQEASPVPSDRDDIIAPRDTASQLPTVERQTGRTLDRRVMPTSAVVPLEDHDREAS